MLLIYLIIIILFIVLLSWTWNNVKIFETTAQKIFYVIVGLIILTIVTLIIFNISKGSVDYPNIEIMKQIRRIALLIFIPINGFLSMPHFASIFKEMGTGTNDQKTKKKTIILAIVIIISIIIEITYLKDFQNGIIKIINSK